ncbi:hypothetical protein SteCoe_37683 [Stentor coeruleus]|uniref:Uncharacterized protein n=1 Tax=Stentor coeruleus TaxID=5963 RepID=A0A1R2AMK4_9CILI|nr:hypothetical protein SteCoe_37683 [Stentor coeruleus]
MISLASKVTEIEIPHDYSIAIKKITTKSVQAMQRAAKDENSQCLVNAFLILLTQNSLNADFSLGSKNMKTMAWPLFEKLLFKPGSLIQTIRDMPKAINARKISEADAKKSFGLFNTIDATKLGPYSLLYNFVKESLNYINHCYNLPNDYKNLDKPVIPATPNTIKRLDRKSRPLSGNFENLERQKPLEKPIKILVKKTLARSSSVNSDLIRENTHILSEEAKVKVKQNFEDMLKKSMSAFKSLSLAQCQKDLNSSLKAEKFLMDSRVNKRLHEKFVNFLEGFGGLIGYEGLLEREIRVKIVEEFVKTLSCTEMSAGTVSFVVYFIQTKEFDKYLKKIVPEGSL